MHLTRPKSSKGRSRTAMNFVPNTESNPQPHGSLISDNGRRDAKIRSQSEPVMRHSNHLNQDQVLQQHSAWSGSPPSLNMYKVLPSIQRGRSGHGLEKDVNKELSSLSLRGGPILKGKHEGRTELPDTASSSPTLLLAIKEPGGRRFQQHFYPTDTLLVIKASTEAKYGVRYGEVSVETMDVPRRTFTDMSLTLARCGILNKSVLCIFEQD